MDLRLKTVLVVAAVNVALAYVLALVPATGLEIVDNMVATFTNQAGDAKKLVTGSLVMASMVLLVPEVMKMC